MHDCVIYSFVFNLCLKTCIIAFKIQGAKYYVFRDENIRDEVVRTVSVPPNQSTHASHLLHHAAATRTLSEDSGIAHVMSMTNGKPPIPPGSLENAFASQVYCYLHLQFNHNLTFFKMHIIPNI